MNRLDEIKARADCYEATRTYEHALCLCEQALIADVPARIAAVEAVLALHKAWAESNPTDTTVSHVCEACLTANGWGEPVPEPFPCPTVTAIRTALGEEP